MDDLSPAEAADVLRRLARRKGPVGEAVRAEIAAAVTTFDDDAVAGDVLSELDALAVEELWDRSGPSRYGYVDPVDESWTMVEEVLDPHLERIRQLQGRGLHDRARDYCLAVLDGIDAFRRESDSAFHEQAPDDAAEAFAWVLAEWKSGAPDEASVAALERRVAERFGP